MRLMSVSQMKGNRFIQMWPPEGSSIRAVWDRLQAHKGNFVDVSDLMLRHKIASNGKRYPSYVAIRGVLTDIWGLDIAYKPKGMWCLVGEWKGKEYVDYLAEKYK